MKIETVHKIALLTLLGITLTSCLSGLVESEGRKSLPIIQDFTLADNTSDVDAVLAAVDEFFYNLYDIVEAA